MNQPFFTTTIEVNQSPVKVYDAINRVGDWWQGEVTGNSQHVGDVFEYRMLDIHYSKQKVVELIPNEKVVWLITESNLSSFQDKAEWNGTKVIFDISKNKGITQLRFTHVGLVPSFQCYRDCSGAWGALIEKSLWSLITTGKGQKVF